MGRAGEGRHAGASAAPTDRARGYFFSLSSGAGASGFPPRIGLRDVALGQRLERVLVDPAHTGCAGLRLAALFDLARSDVAAEAHM